MKREVNTSSIAEQFKANTEARKREEKWMTVAPVVLLVVLIVACSVLSRDFFTLKNMLTILDLMSLPLVAALAVTFIIIIGSIDLSIDGVMGLSTAIIAQLVLNNKTSFDLGYFGVLLGILLCCGIGCLNGVLVVKGKIPSFIITFCISSVAGGLGLLSYQSQPATVLDQSIRSLALTKIMGLPIYFYITAVLFVVMWIIQEKTAFGRQVYAIGQNEAVAKMTGIKVDKVKIIVFVIAGLLVGIAGLISTAQFGRGDIVNTANTTFPALTAVVLGGTALTGGKGGVVNTLIGTLIITILENIMILMSVNPYVQSAVQGTFMLVAMTVFGWSSSKKRQIVK